MILLGAAGGDIAGSRFEFHNHRSKDFEMFARDCFFTDDTVMTMAIAKALLDASNLDDLTEVYANAERCMQQFGREYPGRGYGGHFAQWLRTKDPKPYNSFGNGSAMRVSACGWITDDPDKAGKLAIAVSSPTHNHPEGIKGAVATAQAICYAHTGIPKDKIAEKLAAYYDLDFRLDDIRATYRFNETCQETVPQAIVAFLEGDDYESVVRNAISVGGDSDTLAAIAGSIAEAYYGIPNGMQDTILAYLDTGLRAIIKAFNARVA